MKSENGKQQPTFRGSDIFSDSPFKNIPTTRETQTACREDARCGYRGPGLCHGHCSPGPRPLVSLCCSSCHLAVQGPLVLRADALRPPPPPLPAPHTGSCRPPASMPRLSALTATHVCVSPGAANTLDDLKLGLGPRPGAHRPRPQPAPVPCTRQALRVCPCGRKPRWPRKLTGSSPEPRLCHLFAWASY